MDITTLSIKDQINTDFRDYAMYVIQSRGIPNFYDSITPVQRLILLNAPDKFTTTVSLVGGVMSTGLYFHGDCLDYNTEINLADGTFIKIGDWFTNSPESSLLVKCVDENNNETVGVAHSPRIGQITEEIYEIELEDGTVINCTKNHPFRIGNDWIIAEKLNISDDILDITR